ncbi:MAG: HAMP domain-containing protein [Acidiferrobacterales bacterium]|nr:HAMP domain-containing protein [Acidiferrobacterales bacterium]
MNLSLRLIVAILVLILLVAIAGSFFAVHYAKLNIQSALDQNSNLGLDLFSIAVINNEDRDSKQLDIALKQLQSLDKIKTLNVAVTQHSNTLIQFAPVVSQSKTKIPKWFKQSVLPTPKEHIRKLILPGQPAVTIRVIPDSGIQILQSWRNLRLMFLLAVAFTLVAIPVIWLIIRLGLKPLNKVMMALDEIREGDFGQRLPEFNLTDIKHLSQRFNHMAEALEEQKTENQQLNKQMHEIQENERRYLARELHDELGQSINGIKSLAVSIAQQSPEQQPKMQNIREVCDQMHGSVRNMINRLRPAILDELGLKIALDKLVDDWNAHHPDSFCALNIASNLEDVHERTSITIYRVVQECLTNVAKHAQAENVWINIHTENETLHLSIEDNGIGLHEKEHYMGRGLPGIRERVRARHGQFVVDSEINQGVKILITLPFGEDHD